MCTIGWKPGAGLELCRISAVVRTSSLVRKVSCSLQVAKMELDCVVWGWREPLEELRVTLAATGSSAVARHHRGHAILLTEDVCVLC